MAYRTKSGAILTEEMIEELASQAEQGEYPGSPGAIVVAPKGRPPLCEEELVTVAFKIPRSYRDRLDERAASLHESRSQFMRNALEAALA
ncbi:MAG: ribbon-helix-helix protein, CopG family [Adlercreutzia sp.]|nr:ribbon-helix-helix protein, CopG family [Adlercreutzia sp.]